MFFVPLSYKYIHVKSCRYYYHNKAIVIRLAKNIQIVCSLYDDSDMIRSTKSSLNNIQYVYLYELQRDYKQT